MIKLILQEEYNTVSLEHLQQNFAAAFNHSQTFGAAIQVEPIDTGMLWKPYVVARQKVLLEAARIFGHMMQHHDGIPQLHWFFQTSTERFFLPTMDDAIILKLSAEL